MSRAVPAWAGDLRGGLVTAIIGIPLCVGFGLFAFEPMGERYAPVAVLAGVYAFVFAPLIAYLLGSRGVPVFGPRNMATFVIHSMLVAVAASAFSRSASQASVMVLIAAVLATAALIQMALSALSLGELTKYIPHPVIAGFQNGAALLLFLSQVDTLLGIAPVPSSPDLLYHAGRIQPLTLLVGIITMGTMLVAHRVARRIPGMVVGLAVGCGLYYALWAAGFQMHLGALVGEWSFRLPETNLLLEAHELFSGPDALRQATFVVAWAVTLAMVGSLDVLLCLKVIEGFSKERTEGNTTLMRLGVGNFLASGLGALFTSVSLVNTHAATLAGGRSRLAGLTAIVLVLTVSAIASNLIAVLPRVVIAGLLVVTAIRLFDRWTLQLLRSVMTGDAARRKSYLFDLLIIVMVVALTVTHHLVSAVLVGISLAVGSFILRMSRTIIRRSYRCDEVRSRKTRENQDNNILSRNGRQIAVFELEGALFFGTADKLVREMERAFADGVRYAILDLRRLNDLDTTAARLLMQLHDSVGPRGLRIGLSGIVPGSRLDRFVRDCGLAAAVGIQHVFSDVDDATEWAEDLVLADAKSSGAAPGELALEAFDILSGMSRADVEELRALFRRVQFGQGSVIFREGESGREIYLIARGSASVKLRQHEAGVPTRLVTFAPGTVFGEVALLDGGPRSATVEADTPLVCYTLSGVDFDQLKSDKPAIAIRLLTNLAGELGNRLRRANRIIFQLEH